MQHSLQRRVATKAVGGLAVTHGAQRPQRDAENVGSPLFSVEPGGGQGNSKLQVPSSKETPMPNFQWLGVAPRQRFRPALDLGLRARSVRLPSAVRRLPLEFGVWTFFGIWNLGFGASPTPIPPKTSENKNVLLNLCATSAFSASFALEKSSHPVTKLEDSTVEKCGELHFRVVHIGWARPRRSGS